MNRSTSHDTATLRLPKSLAAWGAGQFAAVLSSELQENAGRLPAATGVWAASDITNVTLTSARDADGTITAEVMMLCDTGRSSGCIPLSIPSADRVDLVVTLDKQSGSATIKVC